MEKTNAVWLKWNVDSWCFGWMLINYCWITIRIYTELFSSVRIFSIPTAVSFIKLFQKNWNVLRSRSTPSVSDTSEVSLRLNLLANIHVGTFTSDQIKRDTCGNRSRDLNQELQCGMIFGPSEKHSCQYRCLGQVLQLQGLLRDQLAVLQRKTVGLKSLSTKLCFQTGWWDPSTHGMLPLQGQEPGGVEQQRVQIFCIDSTMKWWLRATLLYFWQEILNLLDSYQDLTKGNEVTWMCPVRLNLPHCWNNHNLRWSCWVNNISDEVSITVVNLQKSAIMQK